MVSLKRRILFLILTLITILSFTPIKTYANEEQIFLGGMPAGFSLSTRGAFVVGICDVITEDGIKSPSKDANIKVGDTILCIDNIEVNNAKDLEKVVKNDLEKNLTIKRQGEIIVEIIKPAKDVNGKYKLGIFIRDEISGVGTITFIKGDKFASLGHPVIKEDGKTLDITGGTLYNCNITGAVKGERGKAGELRGIFLRNENIANIEKNTSCGVYGTLNKNFDKSKLIKTKIGQAKPGSAKILSTIDDQTSKYYDISIVKVDNSQSSKNFVIKINDKRLIEKTGGIVQGMSGSPIIQDGKLVGAVTHVFINDPTRGFGISINKMLNNM